MKLLASPCPKCPWRLDARADEIPNFSMTLAETLRATCPDESGFGPDFNATWFACHQSRNGAEIPCAGWLATVGHTHPGVRLAIRAGRLPVDALEPAPDWPPLHRTYPEVMAALYATAPAVDQIDCSCDGEEDRSTPRRD